MKLTALVKDSYLVSSTHMVTAVIHSNFREAGPFFWLARYQAFMQCPCIYGLIGSGSIGRCGLVELGLTLLEEVCHHGDFEDSYA